MRTYELNRKMYDKVKKMDHRQMKSFCEDLYTRGFKKVLEAHQQSVNDITASNGVTYYYDGFVLTDEIIDQLEKFSLSAEDDVYSVYLDDGKLVVC